MEDFMLSEHGDIVLDKNSDIKLIDGEELHIQIASNKLKSIANDWYIDNIGCNIESIISMPITDLLIETLKDKIIDDLTKDNDIANDSIYVEINHNENVTQILTYIRKEIGYHLIRLNLDTVGGINCIIE